VVASIAMMLVMHGAYKYVNGWLSNRQAAYLHDAGAHLAAVWAPLSHLTPPICVSAR